MPPPRMQPCIACCPGAYRFVHCAAQRPSSTPPEAHSSPRNCIRGIAYHPALHVFDRPVGGRPSLGQPLRPCALSSAPHYIRALHTLTSTAGRKLPALRRAPPNTAHRRRCCCRLLLYPLYHTRRHHCMHGAAATCTCGAPPRRACTTTPSGPISMPLYYQHIAGARPAPSRARSRLAAPIRRLPGWGPGRGATGARVHPACAVRALPCGRRLPPSPAPRPPEPYQRTVAGRQFQGRRAFVLRAEALRAIPLTHVD